MRIQPLIIQTKLFPFKRKETLTYSDGSILSQMCCTFGARMYSFGNIPRYDRFFHTCHHCKRLLWRFYYPTYFPVNESRIMISQVFNSQHNIGSADWVFFRSRHRGADKNRGSQAINRLICVWTAGELIISLQRALMNPLLCGEMCSTGNNNPTTSDWLVKPCKHVVLFRATVKRYWIRRKSTLHISTIDFWFFNLH